MIIGHLKNSYRYFDVHPGFKEAFEFIQQFKIENFEPKRLHLNGDKLIAIIESSDGRGRQNARLEAHRKYIDIQYTVMGSEEMGWKPHHECQNVSHIYNPEKDIEFFLDSPSLWLPVLSGSFAIFFPEDAHAPLAGAEPVRKIIMKIALDTGAYGLE